MCALRPGVVEEIAAGRRGVRKVPGTKRWGDAACGGMQRNIRVKIRWQVVVLGSDRPKGADTAADTAIRIWGENRDLWQCYAVWSRCRSSGRKSREIAA